MIDLIDEHAVRFSPTAIGPHPDGSGSAAVTGGGMAVPDSWDPYSEPTWVDVDAIVWSTGFRAALTHLEPLRLRERTNAGPVGVPAGGDPRYESGIRMEGRTGVAKDPRLLLVGYGPDASTLGAARAGGEAARRIWRRLRHQG
jgi:putative oxidoreductase